MIGGSDRLIGSQIVRVFKSVGLDNAMCCLYQFIDWRQMLQSLGTGLEDGTEIEAACSVHPYSGGAVGWFPAHGTSLSQMLLIEAGGQ